MVSRSTWACELKWYHNVLFLLFPKSRSTWACELKCKIISTSVDFNGHAPRERVSWNPLRIVATLQLFSHAPRERVSWNEWNALSGLWPYGHAPRERVSWNGHVNIAILINYVTLHVSVWVEIRYECYKPRKQWVTLHVSVWVEISLQRGIRYSTLSHAPRERVSWNLQFH